MTDHNLLNLELRQTSFRGEKKEPISDRISWTSGFLLLQKINKNSLCFDNVVQRADRDQQVIKSKMNNEITFSDYVYVSLLRSAYSKNLFLLLLTFGKP